MKAAVLTISDSCAAGSRVDESGPAIVKRLTDAGWTIEETTIVPDEQAEIAGILEQWSTERHVNTIITTGGTGFSSRDITPEATLSVVDRRAPGCPVPKQASEAPPSSSTSPAASRLFRTAWTSSFLYSLMHCR